MEDEPGLAGGLASPLVAALCNSRDPRFVRDRPVWMQTEAQGSAEAIFPVRALVGASRPDAAIRLVDAQADDRTRTKYGICGGHLPLGTLAMGLLAGLILALACIRSMLAGHRGVLPPRFRLWLAVVRVSRPAVHPHGHCRLYCLDSAVRRCHRLAGAVTNSPADGGRRTEAALGSWCQ